MLDEAGISDQVVFSGAGEFFEIWNPERYREDQRRNAEKTVRTLTGVVGVTNGITLKPHAMPANIGSRIREALSRQAAREAQGIEISVDGDTVTLKGTVHSWAERRAAIGAAFSAPGVTRVVNDLRIGL
jgi:osmotically-inducible protein OsmY